MSPPASFLDPDLIQQIRDFRKLSPFEKLRMLEEMQRFLELATPAKTKRIREALRSGAKLK